MQYHLVESEITVKLTHLLSLNSFFIVRQCEQHRSKPLYEKD